MEKCVGCLTPLQTGFFSKAEELSDKTYLCDPCSEKVRSAFKNMDLGNLVYFKGYTSFQMQELLVKETKFQWLLRELAKTYLITVSDTAMITKLFMALADGESMVHAAGALYGNKRGILLATNRRLMFVGANSQIKLPECIDYKEVTSVDFISINNQIKITTPEATLFFSGIMNQPEKFCSKIRQQIDQINNKGQGETRPSQNTNEPSLFDILERLGSFRQNGIITDEEFAEQKSKLLERL